MRFWCLGCNRAARGQADLDDEQYVPMAGRMTRHDVHVSDRMGEHSSVSFRALLPFLLVCSVALVATYVGSPGFERAEHAPLTTMSLLEYLGMHLRVHQSMLHPTTAALYELIVDT